MKIRHILGYLGLVPFIIALIAFNKPILASQFEGKLLFTIYSIAILSFLAGSIWQENSTNRATAISSNLLCIYAVTSILLPQTYAFIWLAVGYLLLWFLELHFYRSQVLHRDSAYILLRKRLTLTVFILHMIALVMSI